MLITDLLNQSQVSYDDGDVLAVPTTPVGYAPSILDTESYVKGQFNFRIKGVGAPSGGAAEKDTLTISAAATANGNVTVTLNGVAVVVAVANADTTTAVATKIAAADYSKAGFTASAAAGVVTFTATGNGLKAAPTYSAGTTGATGAFVRTTTGASAYTTFQIVPIILAADSKSFVDDVANPIIVQKAGTVMYATGRNDVNSKDVYHDRSYATVTGITAGQEARQALQYFLQFAKSEYSIGVQDWTLNGASASTYAD